MPSGDQSSPAAKYSGPDGICWWPVRRLTKENGTPTASSSLFGENLTGIVQLASRCSMKACSAPVSTFHTRTALMPGRVGAMLHDASQRPSGENIDKPNHPLLAEECALVFAFTIQQSDLSEMIAGRNEVALGTDRDNRPDLRRDKFDRPALQAGDFFGARDQRVDAQRLARAQHQWTVERTRQRLAIELLQHAEAGGGVAVKTVPSVVGVSVKESISKTLSESRTDSTSQRIIRWQVRHQHR